jgi:hypothetical protein
MMLRTKSASARFYLVDKSTGKREHVNLTDYLTHVQRSRVFGRADMTWQFAQYLKKEYAKKGRDISVFVDSKLSINGGSYFPFIDKNADLANVKWNYFGHQQWILPAPEDYHRIPEKEKLPKPLEPGVMK